jgi:hypothetical protein
MPARMGPKSSYIACGNAWRMKETLVCMRPETAPKDRFSAKVHLGVARCMCCFAPGDNAKLIHFAQAPY